MSRRHSRARRQLIRGRSTVYLGPPSPAPRPPFLFIISTIGLDRPPMGYTPRGMEISTATELERARSLIAALIRLSGQDRQTLDRELGEGRGFTSQILVGRVKLRFEHVLRIIDGLHLEPAVFFALLYPIPPDDRERLAQVAAWVERLRLAGFEVERPAPPASPEAKPAELAALIRAEVERAFEAREARGRKSNRARKPRA